MARLVKSDATPIISIVIKTILQDNSFTESEYHIGDMIENLRYIENDEIKTITGKLAKINFNNLQTTRQYGSAATLRSFFADDVLPISIDVDCSDKYASNVVTVPCNEIVENLGVENVKRMKTYMKYGVRFTSFLTNMDDNDFTILEGQDIQGLVYMSVSGDVTSDVRVVTFTYDANLIPITMVVIENGKSKQIDIDMIKDMSSVVAVTPATADVNSVLSGSDTGVISLASGNYTADITLTKNSVIRGAFAGISAVERKASPESFGEETILDGTITIPDGTSLTLDGVSLSKNARIVVKDAEKVELNNSIIEDVTPNGNNSFVVYTPNSDKATKVVIKNSYFGANGVDADGNEMKNGLELTAPLADGSIISGCYFAEGIARNNLVCLYNIADGATVTVRDCVFEMSANAVRVASIGNVEAHINLINNTYYKTLEGEYAGFLLIQPYGKMTESMAKNVINMVGTKNESDQEQVYYMYYGSGDTQMTSDKLPTLIVDGEVVMAPVPVEE